MSDKEIESKYLELKESKGDKVASEYITTHIDNNKLELKHVINHPICLSLFFQHCQREYSTENIEFWMDVTKYKKIMNKNNLLSYAIAIQKRYIDDNSLQCINISSKYKSDINKLLDNPNTNNQIDIHLFDHAMNEIYTIMNKDSFNLV